jgi:hypothetical protein
MAGVGLSLKHGLYGLFENIYQLYLLFFDLVAKAITLSIDGRMVNLGDETNSFNNFPQGYV